MSDRFLILGAAFLRALGVGLLGVLFALYLSIGGLDTPQIGFLVAVGLAGNAVGTLGVTFWADRFGHRNTLILLSGCAACGGLFLALFPAFWGLTLACFVGMVNAMGRERGALFTLEQAILPNTSDDRQRTKALAWYNVIMDLGQAVGSLLGIVPVLLRQFFHLAEFSSYRWTFAGYGALLLVCFFLYTRLSPRVERTHLEKLHPVSPQSRRIITRISLLFGLDSLAGGFLPGSLIAYWFFKRFGLGEEILAPLFFVAHLANAFSYLAAERISRHIGLVKTMVFTHTPANLCLIAIPFAPNASVAMGLYLLRECLVEMDVPTRQSYVLAVVAPHERTVAAGVTNLTRLLAWVAGPTLAGIAMKGLSLSFPLFLGGSLKILYDISLYFSFRHLKPPEER